MLDIYIFLFYTWNVFEYKIKLENEEINSIEKKSESWCSWAISKIKRIKSLICLREHKQISKHLDMNHLGKLLDLEPLEELPENQFDHIVKYLDTRSLSVLSFANKKINEKIGTLNFKMGYHNYYCDKRLKNLFYCVSLVIGSELDDNRDSMQLIR